MHTLANDILRVEVTSKGAELKQIRHQHTQREYLWQADSAIWGRSAPVLFPIVGKVKNNVLLVSEHTYPMSQHGFARDREFTLLKSDATTAHYRLKSDAETLNLYPYPFELDIVYRLIDNCITCTWIVTNTGTQTLWFSIGAHPGFNLFADMSEYVLAFEPYLEYLIRSKLENGLLNGMTESLLLAAGVLPLSSRLFDEDALVIESNSFTSVELKHLKSNHRIHMFFEGFPFLGIWTPKNCSSMLCIEPWYGIADSVAGHEDICNKKGILSLEPNARWEAGYSMMFE